jgi:hypothetical protein
MIVYALFSTMSLGAAAAFGALPRNWVEAGLGEAPDGGSGLLEYSLAVGFAVAAASLALLALWTWARTRAAEGVCAGPEGHWDVERATG